MSFDRYDLAVWVALAVFGGSIGLGIWLAVTL